jgi:Tol biopolymer transport system component
MHTTHGTASRRLALIGLLLLSVVLPVIPANATFHGRNGDIAFRRFLNQEQTWGAVFMIRPDGTGERQITFPPYGYVDRNPDVSPDGRRIAFQRQGVDCGPVCFTDEIWVVDVDGSNLRQLTVNPPGLTCIEAGGACDESPGWSPNGRKIVFTRVSGPLDENDIIDQAALFTMNADGTDQTQITQLTTPRLGEDLNPQWSPDGRRIVFERFNVRGAEPDPGKALWIVDLRTGREHRVTPYELEAGDTPDWSPNGQWILFHDDGFGNPDVSANLYKIRPNGRGLTQLTFETGGTVNYLGASWSPDGRYIVTGRRPATGGVNADIFVLDRNGNEVSQLTRTDLYDSYPDWGPVPRRR